MNNAQKLLSVTVTVTIAALNFEEEFKKKKRHKTPLVWKSKLRYKRNSVPACKDEIWDDIYRLKLQVAQWNRITFPAS